MANNNIENKELETKKNKPASTKKSTNSKTNKASETKKNSTAKKSTSSKKTTTNKKSTSNNTNKKTTSTKKSTAKTTTPKKSVTKKVDKELEKTIIIEDIENKINNIVENKKVDIKEQVIEKIKYENIAKLENAKFKQIKKNKHLLSIGVIVSLLGIIALIITLIANRIVDKEFISDTAITLMVIASIIIECFGAFIIINES